MVNDTAVIGFILLGFSSRLEVQVLLFAVFLLVYIITLLGNLSIITLTFITPKLHTPMYFFLFLLSWIDILSSSVTVPRMLTDFLSEKKFIAFFECITQVFVFLALGVTEALILSCMCFDRYVAICLPLNYTIIVSWRFCIVMAVVSWIGGVLFGFTHSFLASQLPYCGDNIIDHYLCDIPSLLKLACSDTMTNKIVFFSVGGCLAVTTFLIIIISYIHIIRIILKIPTVKGRQKIYSTCSSHLLVVTLFFGTAACTHFTPVLSSTGQDKVIALFYTVFAPMLNPMIYSLRNEDVKNALKKAILKP